MEKSQISKSKEGQAPPFDACNAGFFSRSKNLVRIDLLEYVFAGLWEYVSIRFSSDF